MRITTTLAIAVLLSAGALAEPKLAGRAPKAVPSAGAQWDDSHMLSRHEPTPRTARPRLEGESGYGALTSGNATRSAPVVQELEFTTQREWEQGALSTGSNAKAAANASASASSESSGISRNSGLRGAATSGRRSRR